MSLGAGLGPERNLLDETPEHCNTVSLDSAILFEHQLEKIKHLDEQGFPSFILDCTWPAAEGAAGMKARLDELCAEVETNIQADRNILILIGPRRFRRPDPPPIAPRDRNRPPSPHPDPQAHARLDRGRVRRDP